MRSCIQDTCQCGGPKLLARVRRTAILGESALPSPHRFIQEVLISGRAAGYVQQQAATPSPRPGSGRPTAPSPTQSPSAASVSASQGGSNGASARVRQTSDNAAASADNGTSRFLWTLQMREDHCWVVTNVAPVL